MQLGRKAAFIEAEIEAKICDEDNINCSKPQSPRWETLRKKDICRKFKVKTDFLILIFSAVCLFNVSHSVAKCV